MCGTTGNSPSRMLKKFVQQGRMELSPHKGVGGLIPTARVQRGPLLLPLFREWPRLPSTARIGRAPFHRARSASKEGTWPLPLHPSEAARCASKGIVPATPPLFQHPARSAGHLSMQVLASQGEAEDTRRLRGVEPCAIQTRTRRGRGVRSTSTFYNLERLWPKGVKKTARRERSIGRMSRG